MAARKLDNSEIGKTIAALRTSRGMTQQNLADKVYEGMTTISRIEKGHRPNLSVDLLQRIAEALDVTMNDLCYAATDSPSPVFPGSATQRINIVSDSSIYSLPNWQVEEPYICQSDHIRQRHCDLQYNQFKGHGSRARISRRTRRPSSMNEPDLPARTAKTHRTLKTA